MSPTRPTPDFDDELLSAYVDNELTPQERAGVEERLRTDARAQQVVAELRRMSEAVKALPRVPLGRDLSASVLAAIEHRSPPADSPTVLTLPDRRDDHAAGRRRGLIWTALAVAAALMLMVWRPEKAGDERPVAQSSGPSDQQLAKDDPRGVGSLERQETVGDAGRTAASSENAASEAVRPSASTSPSSQPNRAVEQPAMSRPRGDSIASPPAAPGARGRDARTAGTVESKNAEGSIATDGAGAAASVDDIDDVADAAEAEPAPQSELRTIEIVVTAEAGVADFQGVLAKHQITMSAEELPAEQAAAWGARRELMPADAEQGGAAATRAETDASDARASEASEGDAILVEASPAVIAALLASLEPQPDGTFILPPAAETKAATAATAAPASGNLDLFGGEAAGRLANRAWRLGRGKYLAEGLAELSSARPDGDRVGSAATLSGAAAGGDSAPTEGRGGRGGGGGFGGGGLGGGARRGLEESEPRERLLILLRPAR